MSVEDKYYGELTDIISTDDLPEIFNFLKRPLESLLQEVNYKSFNISIAQGGVTTSYSVQLVIAESFSLEIPGTGITY